MFLSPHGKRGRGFGRKRRNIETLAPPPGVSCPGIAKGPHRLRPAGTSDGPGPVPEGLQDKAWRVTRGPATFHPVSEAPPRSSILKSPVVELKSRNILPNQPITTKGRASRWPHHGGRPGRWRDRSLWGRRSGLAALDGGMWGLGRILPRFLPNPLPLFSAAWSNIPTDPLIPPLGCTHRVKEGRPSRWPSRDGRRPRSGCRWASRRPDAGAGCSRACGSRPRSSRGGAPSGRPPRLP